ncbi:hypothetical protein XENOCAPTIV_007717 [Xenoophorus captivus]|uniref:Transferrin receptor-like dimerisation domain-containing protein n=1 Tax=Xenoophorus captivus TaxID=1517983 RepID=A0ABV0QZ32_9TELE
MTLRLVHDHLLSLDVSGYKGPITKAVSQIYKQVNQLTRVNIFPLGFFCFIEFDVFSEVIFSLSVHGVLFTLIMQSGQLKDVSPTWLNRARGSYFRAADGISSAIANMDLTDKEACRILNDRIMRVEHSLLSPYVSVIETPFRHLLLGHGSHTLASIVEAKDMEKLRTQLALATWNLQGCANAMAGNVWDIDDEI